MALIKCPECGKEISDASTACIHCGYPISKNPDVQKKVKSNIENKGGMYLDRLYGDNTAFLCDRNYGRD